MTPRVYIAIPTFRPGKIPGAVRMARAQGGDVVVVVENGPAVGTCIRLGLDVVALRSEPHPGLARNAAIDWVRKQGGGLIKFQDDDDWYGPGHLGHLRRAWCPGRIVGQSHMHVRSRDNRLLLLESGDVETPVPAIMPQTTLAHSNDLVPWLPLAIGAEDPDWCKRLISSGREIFSTAPGHWAFDNGDWDHVWAPPDSEWAVRVPHVFDLGDWDPDVVRLQKPPPQKLRIMPSFEDAEKMMGRLIADGVR